MTEPSSARSALGLRAVLAAFGALLCLGFAIWAFLVGGGGGLFAGIVLVVLALVALVDEAVVLRRIRAGRR